MNSNDIKKIFSNLCCSKCRNDFGIENITVKEQYGSLMICNLTCQKCGMNFGDIIFNYNQSVQNHNSLDIIEGPPPIGVDDVLDAHEFIKKNL